MSKVSDVFVLEVTSSSYPSKTLSVPVKVSLKYDEKNIIKNSNIKKISFTAFLVMILLIALLSILNALWAFFYITSKRKTTINKSGTVFFFNRVIIWELPLKQLLSEIAVLVS